ncbi:ABC transporter ATP-binding protein [Desemzia sp. RIT804]|uniref:ABC transporter ATP-binding protein n=1 Tax=Desemzia sp. RIT 804 TaxID=2810209 RepID=UPI00194DF53C|nr:ABC transporter ATP-binding protein [Desemzia sp. RIT 804]MBM6614355.1 ABC transporter ATP-binding protein [Desemzia sp. RIT 804]
MEAIVVKELSVGYDERVVIEKLGLSILKGKINVIIGANGCGKSTLLKSIARVIKPQSGAVYINGKDITKQKEKAMAKQIAFLPQEPICPVGLTVRELVAYGRFPYQKSFGGLSKHDKEMIDWAIEETELQEFAHRKLDTLSQGQRQRVWIAMTIAQETDIIMLDEPTTYLDLSYQQEILQLLSKLNQTAGFTVVMVLHELNNACKYGDNIIGLKNGKLICEGSPCEAITKENLSELYGIDATLQISENKQYPICLDYEVTKKVALVG